MTEEEAEAAEVVHQPAEVRAIRNLLVRSFRALGIRTGEDPVALSVGDDRGLEVDVRGGALVIQALGELERALDILARGFEVTAAPVAARPPGEHVRAKVIRRDLGALGELQRLVEEPDRRLDAVELVARHPEPEQDIGPLDVAEGGALAQRPRPLEQRDRLANLAATHANGGLP